MEKDTRKNDPIIDVLQGFKVVGTPVYECADFDSPVSRDAVPVGYLLAMTQVPAWLCSASPDVANIEAAGGPAAIDYGVEWYEKIVILSAEDAKSISCNKDFNAAGEVNGFARADLILQPAYGAGCSFTSPIASVVQYSPGGKTTNLGRFHALVDQRDKYTVLAMRIVEVDQKDLKSSLDRFVKSNLHKANLAAHVSDANSTAAKLQKRMFSLIKNMSQIRF